MTTPFTYDFGYTWWIGWGHLIPITLFGGIALVGVWRRWRRWLVIGTSAIAVWAIAGLLITQFMFRLNLPVAPATDRFLSSGTGRVVDVGAGSGRATIGLLLARPRVTVTAVDIYHGYYGIDDNTPERLMVNARIAGVAERAEAKVGDARELPLAAATYDGVVSVAAIDHLPRAGIPKALGEVARILKPGGEFLLTIVNVDAWGRFASPHALGHHPPANAGRWRTLLESAGFEIVEQGTQPGALYFFSRKSRPNSRSSS
jgi:SAM-dependent methyltransferase